MSLNRRGIDYKSEVAPCGASKAFVEDYADKVRDALDVQPREDLNKLVELLGGRLNYLDLDEWAEASGSIYVHGKHDFDIVVPIYTSPLRDRFTIAHELGHYFLHSRQGEVQLIATRRGTGRTEWEANWFAAALLMPASLFRIACQKHGDDIERIAADFAVSVDAAKTRKAALGG